MGPGLSLHFILQGQETKRQDWARYLLMTLENYLHANTQRQCRAALGTAPAHPLSAGLVQAVGRQQGFLLPTRVFWDEGWHRAPPATLDPPTLSPGAGALQTFPYHRSTNEGWGSSLLCSGTRCPWLQPLTHCQGSPEQKPQASGMTKGQGTISTPQHHTPQLNPPAGESPTSGQQRRSAAVPWPQRRSCEVTAASETAPTMSLLSQGCF